MSVVSLGNDIYQIDVCGMGLSEYTSVYLVKGEKVALIETGATPGIKYLFSAFEQLNIRLDNIDYIIVTHVHLDHSGGAGVLLHKLPEARVLVHPRGARHLVDPSRLCKAVKSLYGETYDEYFAEVVPVSEERVYSPADGEKLDLGKGRVLTFYYTLGHALHHMVIYDSISKGLFSGDALGIRYHIDDKYFIFPVTPPPDFNFNDALAACNLIRQLSPECIYFTHFGKDLDAFKVISRYEKLIKQEIDHALKVISKGGTLADVEKIIWDILLKEMAEHNLEKPDSSTVKRVSGTMSLSARGIFEYLNKTLKEMKHKKC